MRKVNNILKIVGTLITAFCLTICIISIIGLFNSTHKQQTIYAIYSLIFAGLGVISGLSILDDL